MKKVKVTLMLLAFVLVTAIGCNDSQLAGNPESVSPSIGSESIQQDKFGENSSAKELTLPQESLEQQIIRALDYLPAYTLIFSYNHGHLDIQRISGGSNGSGDVCKNTNKIKFAKCVDDWLTNHPGGCVKVWQGSDGCYHASRIDC